MRFSCPAETQRAGPRPSSSVWIPTSSGNSNLYRSANAGGSWAVVPGGPTNMITPHASLGTDGTLWIVYDSGGYGPNGITTGQIWKLNTSTLAWTHVTLPNPAAGSGGYGGISVDPENAQHVVVSTLDWWGGPDHIYSTNNGGTSWSVIGNAAKQLGRRTLRQLQQQRRIMDPLLHDL